ncbi:MAG TPA: enhanced serine sensitivity protein SseB C-terminal domain-containing protein [Anaerolineales bacterium]|nr:enhanced serine sensitivity protein SseB C-terminal domain-containing protein [Anaerolineales bacterium]
MFSKLFGKKPKTTEPKKFYPENRLEALLMQAANDPAARPEFVRTLLEFDLFILIDSAGAQYGSFVAKEGDTMRIKGVTIDGQNRIPIFTSERRLREFIQTQESFARLKGQDLFAMLAAQNSDAILNPGASYGKFFTHQEILSLANGTYFEPGQQVLQNETKVLIGMPKEYPAKLVEVLRKHFRTDPRVKKAYFAQIHMPDSGEPPHLIISIEADGDFQQLATSLNEVVLSSTGGDQIIDMVQFGIGTLDDFFRQQKPFYEEQS